MLSRLWICVAALSALGCAEPPAAATVVLSEEVGFLQDSELIQGRDGGASALLWGRSVFVYGDTVLNVPDAAGQTWHHNSYAFSEDGDASDGVGPLVDLVDEAGAPRYFIAPTADEASYGEAHQGEDCAVEPCQARYAVWPAEPVWDPDGARALVFYELVHAEPGDFNFEGRGQSIAVWQGPDEAPVRPEVAPGAEHPTLLWPAGEPGPAGVAPFRSGSDLCAFTCRQDGLARPCVLYSAPLADALDAGAWRVWDGEAWSADLSSGKDLFDGAPIMSVHRNAYLDAWVAVYSEPLTNDVALRTAPDPTGPWSGPVRLFTGDHGSDDTWVYDALAHAELEQEGGRVIYITYSRLTGETWFSTRFPVVRVELARAE